MIRLRTAGLLRRAADVLDPRKATGQKLVMTLELDDAQFRERAAESIAILHELKVAAEETGKSLAQAVAMRRPRRDAHGRFAAASAGQAA